MSGFFPSSPISVLALLLGGLGPTGDEGTGAHPYRPVLQGLCGVTGSRDGLLNLSLQGSVGPGRTQIF